MREIVFLNQGAVTVESHNQLRNYLSNRESKKAIRNHPSIHTIIIIRAMHLMIGNQIRASDVY